MDIIDVDRTIFYLHESVKKVYRCIKRAEFYVYDNYSELKPTLPENIKFLFSDDLQREFPNLTPKQREYEAAKKYGAIFITGIGAALAD